MGAAEEKEHAAKRIVGHLRTNRASRVLDADASASSLLRRATTALVGKPLAVFVPIAERSAFRSRLALVPMGGCIENWPIGIMTVEGGETVRVIAQVEAVPATADAPPMVGDVVLRWRLSAEAAAAAAANRDAAAAGMSMSDLVAQLGHELNQPLSAIVSYARGALLRSQAGTLGSQDLQEVLTIIIAETMRVADRIRLVGTRAERSE